MRLSGLQQASKEDLINKLYTQPKGVVKNPTTPFGIQQFRGGREIGTNYYKTRANSE
jgi:hypothetical protein